MTKLTYQPRGQYFEQFEIGQKLVTAARTITEADIVNFAGMTGDFNQIHTDAEFAAEVRRAIFTFANIPGRVTERDVPRIVRGIDQAVLVQALGYCAGDSSMEAARDYILDNMSKRMAESLREEIGEAGTIAAAAGEEAMNSVVGEIRRLVEEGELLLVAEED